MLAISHPEAALRDLKGRVEGVATALLARNGEILFADLPASVVPEVFAIMCATAFGAAVTAYGELGRSPPDRAVFEGRDARTVMVAAGTTALVVAVVSPAADLLRVIDEVAKFSDLLTAHGG